jgi:hypothetical protein
MARKEISPCVRVLIAALESSTPEEAGIIIRELEGLCGGYRDGKKEAWEDLLHVERNGQSVLAEQASEALAATMTEARVLPHRGRGAGAPAPKGWT